MIKTNGSLIPLYSPPQEVYRNREGDDIVLRHELHACSSGYIKPIYTYIRRQIELQLYRRELARSKLNVYSGFMWSSARHFFADKWIYASAEATCLPQLYRVYLIKNMVTCQSDFLVIFISYCKFVILRICAVKKTMTFDQVWHSFVGLRCLL